MAAKNTGEVTIEHITCVVTTYLCKDDIIVAAVSASSAEISPDVAIELLQFNKSFTSSPTFCDTCIEVLECALWPFLINSEVLR